MLKQTFWWVLSMWAGAPGLIMEPCIVDTDRIVIRNYVQYQFEFQGSSAYSVGGDSGHDRRADSGDQYNFFCGHVVVVVVTNLNQIMEEEMVARTDGRNGNFGWVLPMWADRFVIYRLVININILTKFHKDWMQTINILTKFHKDWMKTVTFTVYTNTLLTDAHSHAQRTTAITWSNKLTVSLSDS
ncbi:hypothetical protein DPMN_176220 [Dreissena polymorpha]|uniref:Uncharacterized protein n=1 Tax=Dreissena polymorpha TaxID=45954 RepID=A0A9D4EAV0_DREPO|nr:hypothetical protein DPMN_176220 [Dreissena polymorpha]